MVPICLYLKCGDELWFLHVELLERIIFISRQFHSCRPSQSHCWPLSLEGTHNNPFRRISSRPLSWHGGPPPHRPGLLAPQHNGPPCHPQNGAPFDWPLHTSTQQCGKTSLPISPPQGQMTEALPPCPVNQPTQLFPSDPSEMV